MTFDETLIRVLELLQREGRVSYRALRRRFDLDEEYLEDLKAEIIQAKKLAVDEDGAVLVWTGDPAPVPGLTQLPALDAPLQTRTKSRSGTAANLTEHLGDWPGAARGYLAASAVPGAERDDATCWLSLAGRAWFEASEWDAASDCYLDAVRRRVSTSATVTAPG